MIQQMRSTATMSWLVSLWLDPHQWLPHLCVWQGEDSHLSALSSQVH